MFGNLSITSFVGCQSSSSSFSSSYSKDNSSPYVRNPGDHDVLFGRGGAINSHPGNIMFRHIVNSEKEKYMAAPKNSKPKVAHRVVKIVRDLDPPGRFLAPVHDSDRNCSNKDDVLWQEVGDKKARAKASQCLREKKQDYRLYNSSGVVYSNQKNHKNIGKVVSPHLPQYDEYSEASSDDGTNIHQDKVIKKHLVDPLNYLDQGFNLSKVEATMSPNGFTMVTLENQLKHPGADDEESHNDSKGSTHCSSWLGSFKSIETKAYPAMVRSSSWMSDDRSILSEITYLSKADL